MQESQFDQINRARWQRFDALLNAAESNSTKVDLAEIPELLQQQSNDLSLARHRMYSANLCEHLNSQVIRGFKLVQKNHGGAMSKCVLFFLETFPRALRKEWKLHLACWLVFLLPAFTIILLGKNNMEWVSGILGSQEQAMIDHSYGKGGWVNEDGEAFDRGAGGDFLMFTHYISNNIGIDFQIFASGILGGVGSLFYLFYNSLSLGATVCYVEAHGSPMKLYGFVSSHAPYELWAMIISGVSGIRMGLSVLIPGRRSRVASLKHHSRTIIPLILGAASMTFLAAIIEGFWSANLFTSFGGYVEGAQFKILIGFAGWLLLIGYFLFCGRRNRA